MSLRQYFKQLLLCVGVGVMAGLAAALFLYLLQLATDFRDAWPVIVWGLPLAGLVIGYAYRLGDRRAEGGTHLILDEIHRPAERLPLSMAPWVLLSTVLTHLFGGSAGREGTAVQMGASLADQWGRIFKLDPVRRRHLLMAGMGAGFGAAIGTPFAGAMFGIEVVATGVWQLRAAAECTVAAFAAYGTCLLVHAPHSHYPAIPIPAMTLFSFLSLLPAGLIFGLTARCFMGLTHGLEHFLARVLRSGPWRMAAVGLVLAMLYQYRSNYQYAGLGIPTIVNALEFPPNWQVPWLKALFTALTLAAGFKGGEFIPLVFIGTTLGSFLGQFLPITYPVLAAVGFAAVFAGAANTPLACTLMAVEIFGTGIAPYAWVGCFLSYLFSGHPGIYKTQPLMRRKLAGARHKLLVDVPKLFGRHT